VKKAPTSPGRETGLALYVYGIVPADSSAELFGDVRGVDPGSLVELVREGDLAAITGRVSLGEFGEDAIEANLRDPIWLEEKVRAHDRVLEAAVGSTTILPFRFGAIYRGQRQVRSLLAGREDFARTLARLRGTLELGVKAFLDGDALRERLASERGLQEGAASSGRAYMQRRQLDRDLDEEVRRLAADCVETSHERLTAAALEGRLNPLPRADSSPSAGEIVLNGAYLVRTEETDRFRRAVSELEDSYADTIKYRVTGPWPPYNFVEERDS
jgi:hypothetical protein